MTAAHAAQAQHMLQRPQCRLSCLQMSHHGSRGQLSTNRPAVRLTCNTSKRANTGRTLTRSAALAPGLALVLRHACTGMGRASDAPHNQMQESAETPCSGLQQPGAATIRHPPAGNQARVQRTMTTAQSREYSTAQAEAKVTNNSSLLSLPGTGGAWTPLAAAQRAWPCPASPRSPRTPWLPPQSVSLANPPVCWEEWQQRTLDRRRRRQAAAAAAPASRHAGRGVWHIAWLPGIV